MGDPRSRHAGWISGIYQIRWRWGIRGYGGIRGIRADGIGEPDGPDSIDVKAYAPKGQIQSAVDGSEHQALCRRMRGELEGSEEDLFCQGLRIGDCLNGCRRLHCSAARSSHRRRQLTRCGLDNAYGCRLSF